MFKEGFGETRRRRVLGASGIATAAVAAGLLVPQLIDHDQPESLPAGVTRSQEYPRHITLPNGKIAEQSLRPVGRNEDGSWIEALEIESRDPRLYQNMSVACGVHPVQVGVMLTKLIAMPEPGNRHVYCVPYTQTKNDKAEHELWWKSGQDISLNCIVDGYLIPLENTVPGQVAGTCYPSSI